MQVVSEDTVPNNPPEISSVSSRDNPVRRDYTTLLADIRDPDGDTLSITWGIESKPDGSDPRLDGGDNPTIRFDRHGTYTVKVTANDGNIAVSETLDVVVEQVPQRIRISP